MQVTASASPSIFNYQPATSVRGQSRAQGATTVDGARSNSVESVNRRAPDSNADQKMADISRIQTAFLAALRNGVDIQKHFEPIL